MPPFGFCGSSYTSESPIGDCQRTVNWYPEMLESMGYDSKQVPYPSPKGKSRIALYPSPGLSLWATLPASAQSSGRPRGQKVVNGRHFVVGGTVLYEMIAAADGNSATPTVRSGATVLIDDGLPVTMAVSQIELCVCSGGQVFILNLATNVFTLINQALFQGGLVSMVEFIGSYFVALLANSQKYQISGILNGLSWNGLDIAQVEDFPDNIVTIITSNNELMLGGNTRSQAWYNNGAASFPFAVNQAAAMIEQGVGAAFARDRLDNTVFWLGADERGQGMAWRLDGYRPQRISNHALEYLWAKYPKISDAVSYAYQIKGHGFWQIYFPSATVNSAGEPTQGATWVYDTATGLWHEREFVSASGQRMAHRSWNHCFAFGWHIVGDWNDNKLYQMTFPIINGTAWSFIDDFGNPIIRERIGPHIAGEGQWIQHNSLALDLEFGLGPQPPLTGGGIPTQLALKDSNNVVWNVTVQDSGNLRTDVAAVSFSTLVLNDPGNTTSWNISPDVTGKLIATATTFDSTKPLSYSFITLGGIASWDLTINLSLQDKLQLNKTGDVARDPQVILSWSEDGGKTWNQNPRILSIGQAGKFKTRAIARMLGRSRDRVYKLTSSDPVPVRILDAYLNSGA
jgi:hypothetical protein